MYLSANTYNELYLSRKQEKNDRGINVYHMSELQTVSGFNRDGQLITSSVQLPIFILSPWERENIARLNSDILGLVLGRMNRISSLEWNVVRKSNEEDKIAESLRAFRQIWQEYDDPANLQDLVIKRRALVNIKEELVDVKDDLSNFDSALRRWRRRLKGNIDTTSQQIVDWLNAANTEDDFEEFQKKWVFDLMIHGASSVYKEFIDGVIENFYTLPGGSVYPLRTPYVGSSSGYVQMLLGYEPKIYFADEMIFDSYVPISARSYGLVPIEALINKLAESMLFDKLAAERADGTKPPEKLVIMGDNSKMFFNDLNNSGFNIPLPAEEQKRVETIINEERKDAVRVLSGVGTPAVVDISKADTFAEQSARQEKLKRDIALVFSATPMEMGLSGSDDTSGRSTSESQERIERERGIFPIVRIIDKTITAKILPFRFGSGWMLEHKTGLTEAEQLKLDSLKLQSGSYDVNTIREERGDEPYPEEIFDRPPNASGVQGQGDMLGSNEMNPLFIRDAR